MFKVQFRPRGLFRSWRWRTLDPVYATEAAAVQAALTERIDRWTGPFQGIETRVVSLRYLAITKQLVDTSPPQ